MPLPDFFSSEEEEQRQQQAAALTPQQVAETAKRAEKPEGFVTQAGQAIEGVVNVLNPMNYAANLIDAGQAVLGAANAEDTLAGEFLQSAGEIFKTQQELDAERTAQIQKIQTGDTEGIPEGQVAYAEISPKVDAIVSGGAQTPYLPLTLAGRLAGQDTSWTNKPASISDDDPLADTIFEITKVLAPTLVLAPLTGGMSVPAGLAVESAVETIGQTSAEDMVAGRTVAAKFGELYDAMGLDLGYENGSDLTRDLIEGKTPAAQALLAVWGFGQNYGINWSAGKLMQLFGGAVKPIFTRGNDWIASKLGKNIDEVDEALVNIKDPEYTPVNEPSEVITPTTSVPTATSPKGSVLNDSGLLQRLLRDIEGLPDIERVPGEFFTDWTALSNAESIQQALQKAFQDIPAFELGEAELRDVQRQTLKWLINNRSLLSDDLAQFMMNFKDDFTIDVGSGAHRIPFDGLDEYMRKYLRMDYGGLGTGNLKAGYVGIAVSRYVLEDLGYRMQKLATQMDDMFQRGEDITPMMRDAFLPLENFVQTFAHPFRHAKRDWFLRGEAQQKDLLSRLDGTADDLYRVETELDDLSVMNIDGVPTKTTIADLWEAAQNGDEKSLKTLKTYIRNLAYGDPAKVIADNEISTKIIREQLMKKNANEKFFYNGMMLGQWATQVNAAVPTVFRQIFEPLALAASPNPLIGPAERMYAIGQFYGGARYMGQAWQALFRALDTNKPAAGYAKYTNNYSSDLLKEVAAIRRYHTRLQIQMQEEGAPIWERLSAQMWGYWQTANYHPAMNLPTRGLMATDEAARVTAGVQVASGRAMRDAHLGKIKPDQIEAQTKAYFKQIFNGPPSAANIKDPEVKAVADRITMQTPLKVDEDTSLLGRYFAAEDAAAKLDPVHRFFSPFTRVAADQIEQEFMAMTGQVPGAQALIGAADKLGWYGKITPYKKYQKMYESADATQKLQLESQLALAQWLTMSTVATVVMGGKITGSDVRPGEPANSIIVPAPWTRKGEIAVPYSKFSPYGVVLNNVANWVRAVETGAWSHERYGTAIAGLVFGYATYGLQRSILQGQQQLQKVLDVANFEPWMISMGDVVTSAFTPGIGRELGELINPEKTIKQDRTTPVNQFLSGLAEKGVRSFYAPPMYDIYAKKKSDPEGRAAMQEGGNGFQKRMSVLLNMLYPGNITETDYSDPVQSMMRAVGYEQNRNLTDRIYGTYLNQEQQSKLRYEMQGLLYNNLNEYMRRDYMYKGKAVGKWAKYKRLLKEAGPDATETTNQLAKILSDLEDIHFKTKLEAAARAGFGDDPILRDNIEKARMERLKPEISSAGRQGLYAQAAQQDNPLARQVRDILDIA